MTLGKSVIFRQDLHWIFPKLRAISKNCRRSANSKKEIQRKIEFWNVQKFYKIWQNKIGTRELWSGLVSAPGQRTIRPARPGRGCPRRSRCPRPPRPCLSRACLSCFLSCANGSISVLKEFVKCCSEFSKLLTISYNFSDFDESDWEMLPKWLILQKIAANLR